MRPNLAKPKPFTGKPLLLLLVALILFVAVAGAYYGAGTATAATSDTVNFQARLMNAAGALAPDGDYNVEFKIYDQASAGGTVQGVCTGACKWSETRTGANRVHVANGYVSVSLGSVNAFGTGINWDQQLWVTMNIGGTGVTATWDGEMSPRLKLTAVPYAFRASQLASLAGSHTGVLQFAASLAQDSTITLPDPGASSATVCYQNSSACGFVTGGSNNFIQNQNSSSQSSAAYWISGTGRADTALQTPLLDTGSSGVLAIGTTNATEIDLNKNTVVGAGRTLTVNSALTSLTAGSTGDALHVSNSTSSGNIAMFSDNVTPVVTIADGGAVTMQNETNQISALKVVTTAASGAHVLFNADTINERVGIGGTASYSKFEVLGGDAAVYNNGGNTRLILGDSTVSGQYGFLQWDSTNDYFRIEKTGSNGLKINDNFVSIGNIYPGQPLTVGYGTTNLFQIDTTGTATMIGGQSRDITTASGTTAMALTLQPGTSSGASVNGAAATIKGGDASGTTSVTAGNVVIQGGNATGASGTRNGGSVSIDAGTGATSNGSVIIGGTNANSISLGKTSANIQTTVNGTALVKTTAGNDSVSAFRVQNSSGTDFFVVGTAAASSSIMLYAPYSSDTSTTDAIWLRSPKNTVTAFFGDNDDTSAYASNDSSADLRFNGSGVNWGDIGFYPQGGGDGSDGEFRFSTSDSGISTTPNAKVGMGDLYVNGTIGVQTNSPSYTIGLGAGANRSIGVEAQTTTNAAGNGLTVSAGAGNGTGAGGAMTIQGGASGTGSAASGGNVTVQGGTARGTGASNGGNLYLSGGTGSGSGTTGLVVINTPTFSTAAMQICSANCNITQASVDGNGAVVVNATASGLIVTMNDPTLSTAGRIVYVTAANGSNDFTLQVNGGGTGNQIAMRSNTTATMVWNGSDWTAAGASSSTTLQAAYDNTLTSAGGAELVLSNSANANGLTIRDSLNNPVNGTLLEVQSSSAANLFSVNGTVTDYANNGGAESALGSEWAAFGAGASVIRNTDSTYISNGTGSARVATTGTANTGAKNTLNASLTANLRYNISFAARRDAGSTSSFTDLNVYYSINGTTASVACENYSTQTVPTSVWAKVNCTFTAPASGITSANAILIRQTAAASRVFYVDNLSVTISADLSYATDGSVGDATNFGANWVTAGLGTVSVTRSTSTGNDASDSARAQVTAGAANAGVRNKLSISPLPNTLYRVTVYVNSSNTFSDFKIRYSRDGSTTAGGNYVDCVDYNTQSISSAANDFTKVTCYITTDSTAATSPYVYFVESSSATRTFYVDTFSMVLASNAVPNVQVGGGVSGGPTTLFTLDRGASAPIASDNDALLGSMYYDTTLGKLQCYEADGWGACGSSPDSIVTISPEYTNAVLHGSGVGTMTSDLCSDGLNINDGSSGQGTICGTGETYNFYKWTSPQASAQTYSIYVTYQLPTSFKTFQSGQTSIMGRTDSSNSTVQYSVYRNSSGTGLTQCGSMVSVSTGAASAWQTGLASGAADPSTCGFSGGDSIVFKIDVIASNNASAYVGNLNFVFTNQ